MRVGDTVEWQSWGMENGITFRGTVKEITGDGIEIEYGDHNDRMFVPSYNLHRMKVVENPSNADS